MAILLLKLRDVSLIFTRLICLFVFTVTNVEGYASWCDFSKTVFVPEESTATFLTTFTFRTFRHTMFVKTDRTFQTIFWSFHLREGHIFTDNLDWCDPSWKNRTNIISQLNTKGQIDIRIEISNISMKDNGTYYFSLGKVTCFILFVMQIRLEPRKTEATEENMPVYVYAHPHASVITRPFANATMTWLVNGLSVNKTASFIQQDGLIWIPHITRGLDGSNVTYRSVQDNGNVNEVNYTMNVTYGPSQSLSLEPGQTQYYLVSGDIMPDITCTADCKPPCSISWGKYGSGGTLRLGEVTSKDTGECTCTATRTGVKTVKRTINIHVAGFNNSVRKSLNQTIEDCSNSQAADNHGLEHYEALDTNTIQKEKVYEVPTEVGLETYENIRLSSISTPEVQVAHS
ncbi:uncharacterized protein LOC123531986 [Mercenaria mercenaria]|uniref:uncharacterized protein LOC123531986 n=1 Tax=Mercenaria mercenaria TaxID=6596 RepID=UPI00234F886F|nr:uncharacterized protein LOC123531986 [Mercenaria mercenaria]